MKWIEKMPTPFFMSGVYLVRFLFSIISFVRHCLTMTVRFDVVLAICSFFAFFCGTMNWLFERLPYSTHLIGIGMVGFLLLVINPLRMVLTIAYQLIKK